MSKPKPGLGKGLVRNLTVSQHQHQYHAHHHSSSSSIITLAPVIGQHGTHSYSTSSNGVGSSKNGWPTNPPSSSSSSTVSLLPTWDQLNDIVLPYHSPTPRTRLKSTPSSNAYNGIVRQNNPSSTSRKYSSLSISPSAFLTSPIPPSLFFDKSLTFQSQPSSNAHLHTPIPIPSANSTSPAQISLEALLTSLESSSFNTFDNLPPDPPSSSSPSPSRGSSPSHPAVKSSRSTESHTVLSPNPLSISDNDSSNFNQSISFNTNPLLSLNSNNSSYDYSIPSEHSSSEDITNSPYSSTLIFHLGCSGLAKERLPIPSSSRRTRPPTPPRQRSFPLPEVEVPLNLKSIGVGEDAYFARSDGLCIADGVGGWSRSAKGSADAGRWSRLLTHFVEEELSDWWNGKEYYLLPKSNKSDNGTATATAKGREKEDQEIKKEQQQQKKQGWARESWENKSKSGASAQQSSRSISSSSINTNSKNGERERKPIDPVEIMQRGFEKCLSCINTEGIHGSSTCLLALLHNSTLHIANLGDCCLLLIRKGEVVFRTQEMQHAFNFPLQVGTHSRDEPMKDAQRYDVPVKKGDVVILGSDGLMDNLFDEDILEIVLQFTSSSSSSSKPPEQLPKFSSTSNAKTSFPPFSPQQISETLCRRARSVSELVTATTPFMCKAIEEGIDFVGGKKDDISVLVGVIGDREEVGQPNQQEGGGGLRLHL